MQQRRSKAHKNPRGEMLCIYNRNQEEAEFLGLSKEGSACSRPISTRQLTEAEVRDRVGVEGVNVDSLTYLKGLSKLPGRSEGSLNNLEAAPLEFFIQTTLCLRKLHMFY